MKSFKTYKVIILMLLSVSFTGVSAQSDSTGYSLYGIVRDSTTNELLPFVSVTIKGSSNATITDFDGRFVLKKVSYPLTVVVTSMSYSTRQVELKAETDTIVVFLSPNDEALECVVVTSLKGQRVKGLFRRKAKVSQNSYVSTNQGERYAHLDENGFKRVETNPLSTFSADVDRASYSIVRRMINSGSVPLSDAVRTEEMLNYFSYQFDMDFTDHPIAVTGELMDCPWDNKNKLLMVALEGEHLEVDEIPACNLVFLIDVSGSMSSYNKLPLLKSSLTLLVKKLRPEDKVAIVTYASGTKVALRPTAASNKEKILKVIDGLTAAGSTAGEEGLRLAYKTAQKSFIKDGNNRIILATDGDFNVGKFTDEEMEEFIVQNRDEGIEISVLGFGMGNYKDSKMEVIANKGNGNYFYIDNLLEAKKSLVNEFGGTMSTIAKDVKIQVEFNPAYVEEYRLIGYENRMLEEEDFEDDSKDAGEIGSGHCVVALYEVVLKDTTKHKRKLRYTKTELSDEGMNSGEIALIKVRYKEPNKNESEGFSTPVLYESKTIEEASDNIRYAAAVAEFAMLLKDSKYKGSSSFEEVVELAKASVGEDPFGYRAEFIRLVEAAALLKYRAHE